MKKNPNLFWLTTMLLGWAFDLLFWKQSFGVNFAIFVALCLSGGFMLLWINHQRPARRTLWLIPLILFFAAIPVIRAEPMTVFLGVVFALFLMGVMANTFLGGRWLKYGTADYASGFMKLVGSMIARPLMFNREVGREQIASGRPVRKPRLWPLLRGIAIAVPIVAIFAALLASADTIFSNQLHAFLHLFFNLDNLPEYIFRLCYILLIAYSLAGVFLHAASQSADEKLLGEEKPLITRFLGFTETAIVLGSVIILFAAFVVIQFRYFFGGQVNLGTGGLTDSEYARRGFGELAAVAFLSLLMILGLSTITRRESEAQQRAYSGLSVTLVALVMVILVSAYQRLILNELAHGFFRLRTYSHVFYIWLALLLAAVVLLEIAHRERAFALAALIAALGFAISLSVLNVDGFTAAQSILRAEQGRYLNVADLASLSTDSVPVLVDDFLAPSLPPAIHEAIGAVLLCRTRLQGLPRNGDWRSFSLSGWLADDALQKAQADLNLYHVIGSERHWQVRTPSHVSYDCQ
ncbi:MAG TPA: DUF4173 domain-containing protein [Anaerolineales bacterium]|nr:DUF4173 domain-containing protein [Anaerolineales bacterium]